MSAERLLRLDEVITRAIADGETAGAIALVARQGRIVYHKGFGNRALKPRREPMTLDTVFDMASLTKVIATATSILILVEEGRLSLTDTVAQYLPDFAEFDKERVTLKQMLTHYSGLRPDIDLDDDWKGYETAIQRGYREQLIAVPDDRFVYSDINFFLLGEIVHQVSGMLLDQFSQKRIFEPLGMKNTRFNPPRRWRRRVAPTEQRDGSMLRGKVHDPTSSRMQGVAGHAGLFSTAADTAIFAQMILNGGHYGGTRLLSPLTIERMTTNQSPPGQNDWRGLGFDLRSRFSTVGGDLFPPGSFGHTGFTGTSLWIDPTTKTFVILMSSRLHPNGEGDVVGLRKRVASVVAASILDLKSGEDKAP